MGQMNDDDLQWMLKNGKKLSVEKGETIITQYEPVDTLYIILDGAFDILYNNMKITTLESGEIVGEMSFVDSNPPIASVIAAKKGHVVAIKKDAITAKIHADTGFSSRFYHALSLFLVDRLRSNIRFLGYGNKTMPMHDEPDNTEIDPLILENVTAAGERFQRMLRKFQ